LPVVIGSYRRSILYACFVDVKSASKENLSIDDMGKGFSMGDFGVILFTFSYLTLTSSWA